MGHWARQRQPLKKISLTSRKRPSLDGLPFLVDHINRKLNQTLLKAFFKSKLSWFFIWPILKRHTFSNAVFLFFIWCQLKLACSCVSSCFIDHINRNVNETLFKASFKLKLPWFVIWPILATRTFFYVLVFHVIAIKSGLYLMMRLLYRPHFSKLKSDARENCFWIEITMTRFFKLYIL